eukprot:3640518-Prorocentrum_lima.AAC.1
MRLRTDVTVGSKDMATPSNAPDGRSTEERRLTSKDPAPKAAQATLTISIAEAHCHMVKFQAETLRCNSMGQLAQ